MSVLVVELTGFEPVTPTLPVWCATSCAIAPEVAFYVTTNNIQAGLTFEQIARSIDNSPLMERMKKRHTRCLFSELASS